MIRKLLMIAAAAAIPLGGASLGAVALGSGVANAGNPPLNCSASGGVTFAAPGISNQGSVSASKLSTTNSSAVTFAGAGCGTGGSSPAKAIVSKSKVKCSKTTPNNPIPGCMPHEYVYDSSGQFVSSGVATIQKSFKHISLTVNGITFAGKTTSAAIASGAQCPSQVGFVLSGTVKAKPTTYSTYQLVACLGADTGPGTSGSFGTDIAAEIGGNMSITIATATIDPTHSTLSIT